MKLLALWQLILALLAAVLYLTAASKDDATLGVIAVAWRRSSGGTDDLHLQLPQGEQPMTTHQVTIETDMGGDLVLACTCGAQSEVGCYSIDLDDVNTWATAHTQLPPLPTECPTCGALYGEMGHDPEPCEPQEPFPQPTKP